MPAKNNTRIGMLFFFNDSATPELFALSLRDALPISLTSLLSDGMRSTADIFCAPTVFAHVDSTEMGVVSQTCIWFPEHLFRLKRETTFETRRRISCCRIVRLSRF